MLTLTLALRLSFTLTVSGQLQWRAQDGVCVAI